MSTGGYSWKLMPTIKLVNFVNLDHFVYPVNIVNIVNLGNIVNFFIFVNLVNLLNFVSLVNLAIFVNLVNFVNIVNMVNTFNMVNIVNNDNKYVIHIQKRLVNLLTCKMKSKQIWYKHSKIFWHADGKSWHKGKVAKAKEKWNFPLRVCR